MVVDKSEVKKWVDKNIVHYRRLFGIPHWRISVIYDRLEGRCAAECHKDVEYEQASITIDCDNIEDVEMLERIFKHELCHIVHSPFDLFYCSVMAWVPEGAPQDAMLNLWKKAQELTVINLERMHHGHTDYLRTKKNVKKR